MYVIECLIFFYPCLLSLRSFFLTHDTLFEAGNPIPIILKKIKHKNKVMNNLAFEPKLITKHQRAGSLADWELNLKKKNYCKTP